ncbi:MAG: STAS domain-containing protein [Burkholderiaceae bacterium]
MPTTIAAPVALTFAEVPGFVDAAAGSLDRLPPAADRAAAPDRRLELDLAPLQRFDSSAIAAFIAIERRASERHVELRLLNAPPNLRKLAALYAVDSLLFGG